MADFVSGNALGFLITDASRLFRQLFDKTVSENGFGLTAGDFRMIAHVIRYDGATQNVLAKRMCIEPMSLSESLNRLEAKGLIRRQINPTDRRSRLITATTKGKSLITDLRPVFGAVFSQMTAGLSETEIMALRSALSKIRANLTDDEELLAD